MPTQWSPKSARAWYRALPYPVGANFIPSTAINQLEMWQAETFDPRTIRRELSFARKLGLNVMRVYLHDLLWQHDAPGFCKRIDHYLAIAASRNIRTLFVLFDDCWLDHPALGQQPAPIPFTHNSGWVQSPGKAVVNNPKAWPRLQRYTTELLARFARDPRILAWDLYNEPGNGHVGHPPKPQGVRSLPLLKAVFEWARSVKTRTQPITCAPWNFNPEFESLNRFSLENSDIITFHNYNSPQNLADLIHSYAAYQRPMICSEYMSRGNGSTFPYCLPILAQHNVGAINWGLVAGKTQTIYPWGWNKSKGAPDVLFHDIFHPDGTLLYPFEAEVFARIRRQHPLKS